MLTNWALSQNGLQAIQSLLFGQDGMEDVVFVAINFKGEENFREGFQNSRKAQLGIATLDTRDLHQQSPDQEPKSTIRTQNFCSDPVENRKHLVHQFRFGVTETISVYDFATKLRRCFQIYDDDGKPRKLVMVSHQFPKERRSLNCLRLSKKQDYDSLVTVLDTNQMTCDFLSLPRGRPISLEAECLELGIAYYGARCAGDNANLTLKVALMLAIRSQAKLSCEGASSKLMGILREHCQASPPPLRTDTELESLRALVPTEPIDESEIPIDISQFSPRITKRQWREQRRARKQAERGLLPVMCSKEKMEKEEAVAHEDVVDEESDAEEWTSHSWN